MSFALYKPNSSNTGCAFSFSLGTKQGQSPTVFLNGIKQFSWDATRRAGSFSQNREDPEKNVSVKFGVHEVGGIIHAIRTYGEFSAFHSFNDNKTQITFKPYSKKDGTKAFSFTITRNSSEKFGIGIELGEAEALAEFLRVCLTRIFNEEIDKQEQYRNSAS